MRARTIAVAVSAVRPAIPRQTRTDKKAPNRDSSPPRTEAEQKAGSIRKKRQKLFRAKFPRKFVSAS